MGINKEIQLQNWLIHSLKIDCCSKKCTKLFPQEDLKIFKEKFDALESQQELFIKGVLVSCQTKAFGTYNDKVSHLINTYLNKII
jgi:hypothetical protein